jgi:uncharacterized protein (TIGR03437 family)
VVERANIMILLRKALLIGVASLCAMQAKAAVKLTALQMISTDEAGKIQGVGAHRFKTTNHGGQPCLYVIVSDDLNGPIANAPCPAQNGVNLPLSVGTHTFTIYAENANSYSWNNYTLNLHFDNSNAAQVSVLAPLNSNSTQFFPPSKANAEFTDDLQGQSVKAPNTLEYKVGPTVVRVVSFRVADPSLYNKDRIAPFEAKGNGKADYIAQFTVEVEAPPVISAGGVVNAASYAAKVAPGALFSVFGSDLAAANQSAASVPLPASLAGTTVTVGGKSAPLVFVSATQINAQIPYDVPMGDTVPVVVSVNGKASPAMNVSVISAAPGVFQFGEKRAVVQNADASVNTAENGAEPNSYVVVYLTGAGEVDNPVQTGSPAGSAPLSRHRSNVSATINGTAAEIAFAGLTPQFIGLTQVNLKVPNMAPGTYTLIVSAGGQQSNAAMITIK